MSRLSRMSHRLHSKVVQQDVTAMNEIPSPQRGPWRYKYERRIEREINVYRVDESREVIFPTDYGKPMGVAFMKDGSGQCLMAYQHLAQHQTKQAITPRWNAEKQSCELIWGDDTDHPLEVQQVSQKALEPLFFDTNQ